MKGDCPARKRVYISVCADTVDIRVPFQVTCCCHIKVFNPIHILRYRFLLCLGCNGLVGPFPSYLYHVAFDGPESHALYSRPFSQAVGVILKFYCVLWAMSPASADTIIHKKDESQILCHPWLIYNENTPEFAPPTITRCCLWIKNESIQRKMFALNAVPEQLAFKKFRRRCFEYLFELRYNYFYLSTFILEYIRIIYYCY